MGKKRTRDRLGRWVKGASGNPAGRPRKFARVDHGNLEMFKNTVIEVNTPDGRVVMTREAAVQHRLYQSAMKGNVHAQVHLARRFERHGLSKDTIHAGLYYMVHEIMAEGRQPTPYERGLIDQGIKVLYPSERPEFKGKTVARKRKSRRKAKPKKGPSSPDSKS